MALSRSQVDAYARDGFVLVSGLIPDAIATVAADAMWIAMNADPDDPTTWPDGYFQGSDDPAIVACYTEAFPAATAVLTDHPRDSIGAPGGATGNQYFPHRRQLGNAHSPYRPRDQGTRPQDLPAALPRRYHDLPKRDVPERDGGTARTSASRPWRTRTRTRTRTCGH